MTTRAFWLAALERAVKTFAQTLAALLVADGTGIVGTLWGDRLSVAGMAAVVSVLTSLASTTTGVGDGPSLVNEVAVPPSLAYGVVIEVPQRRAGESDAEPDYGDDTDAGDEQPADDPHA